MSSPQSLEGNVIQQKSASCLLVADVSSNLTGPLGWTAVQYACRSLSVSC